MAFRSEAAGLSLGFVKLESFLALRICGPDRPAPYSPA